MVTRQDDAAWIDFVYWVVDALLHAKKNGVTQATAKEMTGTNLFGPLHYRDMLKNAVQAEGS